MKYTVTELYRGIGRIFREHGAQRVALLSSKTNPGPEYEMFLELAVDGCIDVKELYQVSKAQWPYLEIQILDLNEEENMHLIDEVVEDSILL